MWGAFVETLMGKLRGTGKWPSLPGRGAAALLLASVGSACWAQSGAASADPGTWARIAAFVDMPWMTVILLVAGCALLFHDLLTPLTWGVTGTAGVLLIGLVFASHVTGHTGGWIGVLLLLVGLGLLLLEIHIIPGFGMTGISGLLLLFLGMFWSLGGPRNVAFALPVSSVLAVVTLLAFFAYLPKSAVWQQLGEQMRQRATQGSPGNQASVHMTEFNPIGQHGVVLSALRPYGMADIAGIKTEVVTEGDFLSEGTPIVVSSVDGDRIIVESAVASAAAA